MTSTSICASPCLTVEVLVMVRAGVIKLDIFPPGGCPEGLCAFLLIFLLKASRVSPKTDRGITGYSQNCLQKN